MTKFENQLLKQWENAELTTESFIAQFPIDLKNNSAFIIAEINKAIKSTKKDELNRAINLIYFCENNEALIDVLNQLLINPNHKKHQFITKTIQSLKNPSSISFIKKVLNTGFNYLNYTGSDAEVIAKWFSWALLSIDTKEAIDVMKEFAKSDNEGIKKEMIYRLNKIEKN
jgi:hypothetical protein